MDLKRVFEKQGGFGLLKQYYQGGSLFTAVGEFLLLGRETKALEILRLAAQYKTKKNLEKKYRKEIREFLETDTDQFSHELSNKVWVCWFQGMEQAPELVKLCYESLQKNLTDREIILITSENMQEYARFPEYILEKWKNGEISHTHMTDLLRLELLIEQGGMWIDATVLCTEKRADIPDYFFDSDLFLYQILKPGRDGEALPFSSWLISARTHNQILRMTRDLLYTYWKTYTSMVDYFLLHDFLTIAMEALPDKWNRIPPRDSSAPHMLLLRLFEDYDENMWQAIREQTPFHKLTYKFAPEETKRKDTFYTELIENKRSLEE